LEHCATIPIVPAASAPLPAWDHLVRANQVHGSLYTDPAIYQEELKSIWFRTWVYVGHESEIPNPNDYVLKSIGPEPVLMTRDKSGEIHLLHNRCPHRGNRVCMTEQGNARSFTCPYHGWTFANDGDLKGYPFPSGYEGVDRRELGLGKVARVGIYRGFVFGSMAAEGPTLQEHLGAAMRSIDALCLNLARRRGRDHRRLSQTQGQGQLEVPGRERDRWLPPVVRSRVHLRGGTKRHRHAVQRRVHRRVARLRQRPHRKRPAPRVPQARCAAVAGSAPRPTSCPTTCSDERGIRRRRGAHAS
jgi:nitrite reductase/ring-hydroxylating ferredoxin subunit